MADTTPGPAPVAATRHRWWRVVVVVVAVLGLSLGGLYLGRDALALAVLRQVLDQHVAVGHEVEGLHLDLWSGTVELQGLRIDQPPAVGGAPFLTLKSLRIQVEPHRQEAGHLRVTDITLDGLTVHLVRHQGRVNLGDLLVPQPKASPAKPGKPLAITIERLRLLDLNLFADNQTAEPWAARLEHLTFAAKDLHFPVTCPQATTWASLHLETATVDLPAASTPLPQPFLSWKGMALDVPARTNPQSPLVIDHLTIDGLAGTWDRPATGPDSAQQALARLAGFLPPPAPSTATGPTRPTPPIHLRRFHLTAVQGLLKDGHAATPPWTLGLENGDLLVSDVQVDPVALDSPPMTVALTADLRQGSTTSIGRLGVVGTLDPVRKRHVDHLALRAHLTGIDLDHLDPLLPFGARTVLGGRAVDAAFQVARQPEELALRVELRNERGLVFPATLRGPPANLDLELTPIFTALLGRTTDSLMASGGSAVKAGGATVVGGAKALTEVGGGVLSAGAALGGGLLSTVAGVVTFDGDRISQGVTSATSGTVGALVDGVKESGSAVVTGVSRSADHLTGDSTRAAWWADVPRRHEAAMDAGTTATRTPAAPLPEVDLTIPFAAP